ncbi:Major capsid protein (MCP), partial [Durusdinium trenchii]
VVQLFVNLKYYFSSALSQAFPICCAQFSQPTNRLHLRRLEDLLVFSNPANTKLDSQFNGAIRRGAYMMEAIFLSAEERESFTDSNHTYLIKNMQYSDFHFKEPGATRMSITPDFHHPCTNMMFVVQRKSALQKKNYFQFELTDLEDDHPLVSASLKINGSDRERARPAAYFSKIKPAKHMKRTPKRGIYVYPFAYYPTAWYPSGSINMSRIVSFGLDLTFPSVDKNGDAFEDAQVTVFMENHNILRFKDGQISLRYAS